MVTRFCASVSLLMACSAWSSGVPAGMMIFSSWACANAANRTGIRRADQRTRTMTHLRNAGTGERAAAARLAAGLPTVSAAGHASAVSPWEQIVYSPQRIRRLRGLDLVSGSGTESALSNQHSAFSPFTLRGMSDNPRKSAAKRGSFVQESLPHSRFLPAQHPVAQPPHPAVAWLIRKIGRASCRERVWLSGEAVGLKRTGARNGG